MADIKTSLAGLITFRDRLKDMLAEPESSVWLITRRPADASIPLPRAVLHPKLARAAVEETLRSTEKMIRLKTAENTKGATDG